MSTRASKLRLSEPTKNALADVLGLRIRKSTIGSDEAAESYSQMQEASGLAASLAKYETEASEASSIQDLTAAMLSLYGNQSPDVVIDAGSGSGISSELVRQQLKPRTLILVDMIPEALELAKKRFADPSRFNDNCDIVYLEDRIENLQKNQSIPKADLVFMRLVMYYIPLRDYQAFFASAHHILKPGGTVIFNIPLQGEGHVPSYSIADTYVCIADVMHELYNIPALKQTVDWYHSQPSIMELVASNAKDAGFSRIEGQHNTEAISLKQAAESVRVTLEDLFDGLEEQEGAACSELRPGVDHMLDTLSKRLLVRFSDGEVYRGTSIFKVIK